MSLIHSAVTRFTGTIKLLIVDDEEHIRESLTDVFASPLFSISTAATLDQAKNLIGSSPSKWHCWILDLDLGNDESGLDILKQYPQFSYAIVLSGLRSMTIAADAMKLGACAAIDKTPSSFDRLYNEVCKTAAIGFLLGGKSSPHINLFLLLQDPSVTSIDEWANRANMPLRTLHRICEVHPPLTPRYALALYRTIYYLLRQIPSSQKQIQPVDSLFSIQGDLYSSWIEYILRKFER